MKVYVELNGKQINDVINLSDLEIELNFDEDSNYSQSISINNLEIGTGDSTRSNDGYNLIKSIINKSLQSGGEGVETGLTANIFIQDNDRDKNIVKAFEGVADMWGASYKNGQISLPIQQNARLDWLTNQLDSVSFEYLYDIGYITENDFVSIPYTINKPINYFETAFTIVSVFLIKDKLTEQITLIQEMLASAVNPFEATVIARFIIRLLYIMALMVSLIALVIDLFNCIVQLLKYHSGMNVFLLLKKAIEYQGLEFSSSILSKYPYNQLYILPEKYNLITSSEIGFQIGLFTNTNSEQKGYYKGTCGDLFREIKKLFNARTIIKNNIIYLEPYDFTLSGAIYQLPNTLDSVFEYDFNKSDFNSNIILSFQVDQNDFNTVQEYTGTSYQVIQEPITSPPKNLRLTTGLKDIRSEFALGKRKTELSLIETIFDEFFNVLDAIIQALVSSINAIIDAVNTLIDLINDVFGVLATIGIDFGIEIPPIPPVVIASFDNLVSDRIGVLKMESDFVTTPKLLLLDSEMKIMTGAETFLSAKFIFNNFHRTSLFVPDSNNNHNQYLIKSFPEIPFSFTDLQNVMNNNRIFAPNGNESILTSLKYNPYKQTAQGTYKEKFKYINNLKLTEIEPNGR